MSNLFRKKSLERISSPEQLNTYIRVSTPSVWMVLIAIVVLLTGVCVWGAAGHIDTELTVLAVCRDGAVTAYVREADAEKVEAGAQVEIGVTKGVVASVSAQPVMVDDSFTDYMLHVGGLERGEWVCEVVLEIPCQEGTHAAQIVTDSISPMSFVLN